MNKILKSFFVSTLILALLVITGCGGSKVVGDQRESKTFQGELTELSSFISGLDVTHVLVTDAKERVFLRSLLFDLSDYENKEVRVSGVYTEEDVSDKPVNVLTVEKLDILSDVDLFNTDLDKIHTSSSFGLRFSYPSLLFDVNESESRIVLNAVDADASISLKKFKSSIELDARSYISSNFDSFEFDEVRVGSGLVDAYSNVASSPSEVTYILLRDGFFYELSFSDFSSDLDSKYEQVFNELIETIEYSSAPQFDEEEQEDEDEINDDVEEDDNSDEGGRENEGDDEVQEESNEEPLASTGSSKDPVINAFYKVDRDFISNVESYVSFAFTDNNYFYVIYNSNDTQKRALFSYTEANAFSKVAEFKKGTVQDWDLVSGNNIAYNRPLTLVLVGEEGSTELALQQGYRYFESLPLGFGMQYPMDWYYARTDDKYEFSDKPLGESQVFVSAEVLDEKFSDMAGTKVSNKVKQSSTTVYYVDLEDDVLKISGSSQYADVIRIMATSVVKKSE
jgi:hypothetical protein